MKEINNYLQTIDFVIVGIYLIILIGIGYWVSFVKKKNTNENLFLAGHSLGWQSIGFNMWGTNVGPSMLIASASAGYTNGIVTGNFGWLAFIFIFLLATVFAPRYLNAKVSTLPEFMGKRFGQSTRNILAWYSSITILIAWLSLTLYAGGIYMSQILNLPMIISVLILVLLAAFFTMAGGLKAVAYTNVFQMILLIVVSLILTIVGVSKAGGIMAIYEKTPGHFWNFFLPLSDKSYPWLAFILGYPIMGVWFWCTDQSMVQSVLGAKNLKQGQFGAIFTGWLKIFDVALFIIPGIVCFILFPGLQDDKKAYMTLVTHLLPVGMTGLLMAVIIAAFISTMDSALNSLSTVITMDIYVKKYKPDASQKEVIRMGRLVTLIGGILAIFIALGINTDESLSLFDKFQAVLGFIAPPMSVVFLFGVLWKKTTARAANIILSVGTLLSLGTGILYIFIFPSNKYDFWPHYLYISFFLFILLALTAFLITNLDKKIAERNQNTLDYSNLPRTERQVWVSWIILIVVMICMYIIFNGHH